jgi:putative hydrolase of the HAD superfamily
LKFGISFDFWNTLYGNGDEPERHNRRVNFFYNVVSKYIKTDYNTIEKAFRASTEYFVHEWQNNFRTPTAPERILYMSDILSVNLKKIDLEKTVDFFGKLIFSVPPVTNRKNLNMVRQLAEKYPLGLISDTGYISGNYIRQFLTDQEMMTPFTSLIFSDEHSHCKPHSSLYKLTCDNLKIQCSHLIHIGDLEKTDVKGANDSGGISIKYTGWQNNSVEKSLAVYIVNDYNQLSETIIQIVNR